MVKMGETDPELEKLREILADRNSERELKAERLRDVEFFSKTQERKGFLLGWFLDPRNADTCMCFAAHEALGGLVEKGEKFLEEDLAKIKNATETGSGVAKKRATGILKMMRRRLEKEETQRFRALLFDEDATRERKISMLEYSEYISGRRENMDVLIEFISANECDAELFEIGLETYEEINREHRGSHITEAQLFYIGGALNSISTEMRERGERIYEIMALYVPKMVLEQPGIPNEKKVELLLDRARFAAGMPRSVGVLIDFMLDNESCSVDGDIREAAMSTFQSLVEERLPLTEHHVKRIVAMVVADPSLDVLQTEQRENAFWMFRQLVMNGYAIQRNDQGRIMKAAGEIWPKAKDEPRKEEWRLKKLYGLRAAELVLAVLLVELKAGLKAGWPFRPEDRALISYDTSHEDEDIREAAVRVDALIDEIDDEISEADSAKREAGRRRARETADKVLGEYVDGRAQPEGAGKETLERMLAEAEREAEAAVAAENGGENAGEADIQGERLAGRASRPPREEAPGCHGEETPVFLYSGGLERQAMEAVLDKPGLPPGREDPLRKTAKMDKTEVELAVAKTRVPQGGNGK